MDGIFVELVDASEADVGSVGLGDLWTRFTRGLLAHMAADSGTIAARAHRTGTATRWIATTTTRTSRPSCPSCATVWTATATASSRTKPTEMATAAERAPATATMRIRRVFPGEAEGCDGLDTDCDGVLPASEADPDGDGWLACAGDCDDANYLASPGISEICTDGVDNDCDGQVDEACGGCSQTGGAPGSSALALAALVLLGVRRPPTGSRRS